VLLGAWLIIFENYTGDAAYAALRQAEPFMPYRDASMGPSQFDLTVKHVLSVRYCWPVRSSSQQGRAPSQGLPHRLLADNARNAARLQNRTAQQHYVVVKARALI
jgi:Dual specificity protein phosphatase, N-terminal half